MAFPTQSSKKKIKTPFFVLLGIAGIFFIIYGSYLKYRETILSFRGEPALLTQPSDKSVFTPPVNINIPSAGINLPINEATINNGVWEISDKTASFLATSAKPGSGGNIVIYGHNKKAVFGPLIGRIKKDDLVELTVTDGKQYKYKVTEVYTVTPKQIEAVNPTDYEVLTIYTCTGLLDSKRLIIKAISI